jgi:hypothetical protein
MSKVNIFPGQPIIGQVLSLIPRDLVTKTATEHQSDRYYKKFKTYEHVVTMMYAVMSGSNTIRSVVLKLLGASLRLCHLGMRYFPKRSSISDVNRNRSSEVFASLYMALYLKYAHTLPDSRSGGKVTGNLKIVDSTTISLFSEILKAVGRTPADGKRKGGIKAHTVINSGEDVPQFVCYSASAKHDGPFLKKVDVKQGDIVVFDKAYIDYGLFHNWTERKIFFVTRQKDNAQYEVIKDIPLPSALDSRIQSDQQIRITVKASGKEVLLRRIEFKDVENGSELVFWTNIFFLNADKIAKIYKKRWQIELLFKRLKQNFPLKYFLGDNQNAIEIQIWCCLIAHLLYKVILLKTKRKWAFSNLCDTLRQHLFTYIDLRGFLDDPESILRKRAERQLLEGIENQLTIF